MDKVISNGKTYNYYEFQLEKDFEEKIVEFSKQIFGKDTIYFDVKKKMKNGKIASIPDGFLIDFTFEDAPRFCIIENELSSHDVFKHIGEQILKFAVSYKASGYKIKEFLLKEIESDETKEDLINTKLKKSNYRNIDAFLEDIIFNQEMTCIVVIDQSSDELENVLGHLTTKTDIIEFQAFKNDGNEFIYKFTPFQEEVREIEEISPKVKIDELDTIIVPAREEGFNRVFLGENCWYQIKISSSMLPKIKYIGAYETAPVSAINYYAEVSRIEKYKDSNKYILYFKDKATKLDKPIKIGKNSRLAPQAPRYTNIENLLKAKTLEDVFR
jgi:hypothetical protein